MHAALQLQASECSVMKVVAQRGVAIVHVHIVCGKHWLCVPAGVHITFGMQCRQKTVEVKAKCGSCTLWWCPACLLNRYGEEVDKAGFPAAFTSEFTHILHIYLCISERDH